MLYHKFFKIAQCYVELKILFTLSFIFCFTYKINNFSKFFTIFFVGTFKKYETNNLPNNFKLTKTQNNSLVS